MKKIAVVVPRFGASVKGGAEVAIWKLVHHLAEEFDFTILTSTNLDSYSLEPTCGEGEYRMNNITVVRFHFEFNLTKIEKILGKMSKRYLVLPEEEKLFFKNFGFSTGLLNYLEVHAGKFDLILVSPYLFGNSVFCCLRYPEKTVLIPCLHDEVFAELELVKLAFDLAKGFIFYSEPEKELALRLFNVDNFSVVGIPVGDESEDLSEKNINEIYAQPYVVYLGRKDYAKGLGLLIEQYLAFKQLFNSNLGLKVAGPRLKDIPKNFKELSLIEQLDDVDEQEKKNLLRQAVALIQPSQLESFSLVLMESWLAKTPVIVNAFSPVTAHFVEKSRGGFIVANFLQFCQALNLLLRSKELNLLLGENGFKFVRENFQADLIVQKFKQALLKFL